MSKTKRNILVYSLSMGVPALAMFLISLFVWKIGFLFSGCFTIFAALFFGLIARIILHSAIDKDNLPKTWQLTIYYALGVISWGGVIVAEKPWFLSLAWALSVTSAIMFFSVRYLDKDDNGIPDYMEQDSAVEQLYNTLRYKLTGDVITGSTDASRPLCLINGNALTVNEALAQGFTDIANEGKIYIQSLIG